VSNELLAFYVNGSVSISGTPTVTPSTPTAYKLNSAATTNAICVKASAGTIYDMNITNNSASPRYLKLFDLAVAPTVGTSVPDLTIPLPASSLTQLNFGALGLRFGTGIAICITGAVADNDATAVLANEVKIISAYI